MLLHEENHMSLKNFELRIIKRQLRNNFLFDKCTKYVTSYD